MTIPIAAIDVLGRLTGCMTCDSMRHMLHDERREWTAPPPEAFWFLNSLIADAQFTENYPEEALSRCLPPIPLVAWLCPVTAHVPSHA